MGLSVETLLDSERCHVPTSLSRKMGTGKNEQSHVPVKTSHTGSPELSNQESYRRPRKRSGTPHVIRRIVTFPPCRIHRGKHLENQTHHHGNTLGLGKAQYFVNHWAYHSSRKTVSSNFFIRSSFKRLTSPPSKRDGFSAWVKTDRRDHSYASPCRCEGCQSSVPRGTSQKTHSILPRISLKQRRAQLIDRKKKSSVLKF